jgi:hypothetical protein
MNLSSFKTLLKHLPFGDRFENIIRRNPDNLTAELLWPLNEFLHALETVGAETLSNNNNNNTNDTSSTLIITGLSAFFRSPIRYRAYPIIGTQKLLLRGAQYVYA